MAAILNIETSTRVCSVSLAVDGQVKAIAESNEKNSHAERITLFAEKVVLDAGLTFKALDAVAVSKGPGSYTGLRIGVSTAKGYCYALDIPLISVGTLDSLAYGMISKQKHPEKSLFIPMIDARRMEVYAAVFNYKLDIIRGIKAEIIGPDSYRDLLEKNQLVFGGDGAGKCTEVLGHHKNIHILNDFVASSAYMSTLSFQKYLQKEVEDVAYFEPYYLKDFVAGIPKVKGLK